MTEVTDSSVSSSSLLSSSPGQRLSYKRIQFNQSPSSPSSSSSSTLEKEEARDTFPKKSLSYTTKLTSNVEIVLSTPLGSIHPFDFIFQIPSLMTDCAKLQTERGMMHAHDLLERLLREKRHILETSTMSPETSHSDNDSVLIFDEDTNENKTFHKTDWIVPEKTFQIVMYGWAKLAALAGANKDNYAIARIEEIIERMKHEAEYDERIIPPTARINNQVYTNDKSNNGMNLHKNTNDQTNVADRKGTQRQRQRRERSCRPTVNSYNTLLTAYVNASRYDCMAPQRAEKTLQQMTKLHEEQRDKYHTKPNTRSYGHVIEAYAEQSISNPMAAKDAERILNEMKLVHEQEKEQYEQQRRRRHDRGGEEEEFLMHNSAHRTRKKIVTPDVQAYTSVIVAYGNTVRRSMALRAEQLLLEMIQSSTIRPDGIAIAAAVRAWAKVATNKGRKKQKKDGRNNSSGSSNSNKMGSSPKERYEAAERAEQLVFMLRDLAKEERMMVRTNSVQEEEDEQVEDGEGGKTTGGRRRKNQFDVYDEERESERDSFRSHDYDHHHHRQQQKQHSRSITLAPTIDAYNTALNAWAQSDTKGGASRAESLLRRMVLESEEPAAVDSYNGIPRSDDNNTNDNDSNNSSIVRPDSLSFNTVINAWARHGKCDPYNAPRKAEEILNLMYDLYHSGRYDESVKPSAVTYASVINAWARSGDGSSSSSPSSHHGSDDAYGKDDSSVSDDVDNPNNREVGEIKEVMITRKGDKVVRARRLLDTMLQKYETGEDDVKPNVVAITSVLNAAAHCEPLGNNYQEGGVGGDDSEEMKKDDPFRIALRTYEELRDDLYDLGVKPDHFAFATMLRVIGRHVDKSSEECRTLIEQVFDDACSAGQVSDLVVRALKNSCPSVDLLERLLGSRKLAKTMESINELPADWIRNVRGDRRIRRGGGKRRKR